MSLKEESHFTQFNTFDACPCMDSHDSNCFVHIIQKKNYWLRQQELQSLPAGTKFKKCLEILLLYFHFIDLKINSLKLIRDKITN